MLSPSPRKLARRNVLITLGVLAFVTFLFFRSNPLSPWQSVLTCLTSFFLVFFLWVIIISFQALLPVTNFLDDPLQCALEVYRTSFYLLLHMVGLHGPAVFVKDGKDNRTFEDAKRESWPGVVVVDFNSAVVLEERNPPPGLSGAFINIFTMLGQMLMLIDPRESPRVRGAGIVFTRPRERIRGTVDLRKQFRARAGVSAYTREGIEVSSRVFSIFAVGQKPDVLTVTYVGERVPENLRLITLRPSVHGDKWVNVAEISTVEDELDEADRAEIHANYLNRFNSAKVGPNGEPAQDLQLYAWEFSEPVSDEPVFNARRVFAAVFAQASRKAENPNDVTVLNWTELPTHVAAGLFRELLSRVNYDELYDVRGTGAFPLPTYKGQLRRAMRNNGVLAYRLVVPAFDGWFTAGNDKEGRDYPRSQVLATHHRFPIDLRNSKVLRDRGIRVIMSGFGDPTPVNNAVYQQRLDAWRATWEQEIDLTMADQDWSAMRERMRARSETQQELYYALSRLFSQYEHADEALTLRILQALETAAADPKTRALLPDTTLGLMRHVSALLLPPTEQQIPPQR